MFGKILCKLGIHKNCEFKIKGEFTIQKCSRCGLVFDFKSLSDKLFVSVPQKE